MPPGGVKHVQMEGYDQDETGKPSVSTHVAAKVRSCNRLKHFEYFHLPKDTLMVGASL